MLCRLVVVVRVRHERVLRAGGGLRGIDHVRARPQSPELSVDGCATHLGDAGDPKPRFISVSPYGTFGLGTLSWMTTVHSPSVRTDLSTPK